MFTKAIVRTPGKSMVNGLTSAGLGVPDYRKALKQHREYIGTLERCRLEVIVLPADERFPDSTFVEDVALLTESCAVITRPGAPSRRGETEEMKTVLGRLYQDIGEVVEPGTVDAGDILMAGSHYYIGISGRTNESGAEQVIRYLEKYGMTGSKIDVSRGLHLKTGVAWLGGNHLVAAGEMTSHSAFRDFNILEIDDDEQYAANCIRVNDRVLIPRGYPKAKETIGRAGYDILEVDVSEFRKLDGGLSCLSLRF